MKESTMNRHVRTGIVAVAATVGLGTAGVAIAGTANAKGDDPVICGRVLT
jgi:hypothetical protein